MSSPSDRCAVVMSRLTGDGVAAVGQQHLAGHEARRRRTRAAGPGRPSRRRRRRALEAAFAIRSWPRAACCATMSVSTVPGASAFTRIPCGAHPPPRPGERHQRRPWPRRTSHVPTRNGAGRDHVHDRGVAARLQVGQRGLHEEDRPAQVHVERLLPRLRGELAEWHLRARWPRCSRRCRRRRSGRRCASTSADSASRSPMWVATPSASPPSAPGGAPRSRRSASALRLATTTLAPAATKPSATARPMPRGAAGDDRRPAGEVEQAVDVVAVDGGVAFGEVVGGGRAAIGVGRASRRSWTTTPRMLRPSIRSSTATFDVVERVAAGDHLVELQLPRPVEVDLAEDVDRRTAHAEQEHPGSSSASRRAPTGGPGWRPARPGRPCPSPRRCRPWRRRRRRGRTSALVG